MKQKSLYGKGDVIDYQLSQPVKKDRVIAKACLLTNDINTEPLSSELIIF